MQHYQNILAAVDFSAHSQQALVRAKEMAELHSAKLKVIHVTELPSYPVLEDIAITGLPGIWGDDLADKLHQVSQTKLNKLVQAVGIDPICCEVVVGIAKQDIVKQAELVNADLIIIGRRGLSVIQRLIGSTADAVLHQAHCDVLAVNLGED
ncbi:universal stress protein [Thiomicrospira microaerophila]|uniref:universal stress protein n=1 Tax=Thiomicrospira microaerophila TaxID=406020 RepID=UPI00200E418B|nr:universal stress protein [Thiomicrospira microaerophila]UQB41266.1 universal stress protein [Thiomicrospira microaerophila]